MRIPRWSFAELKEWARRFFVVSRSDRLRTWSPDWNLIGLGLALAALVFGYQPAEEPARWDRGLLLIFTAGAAWLTYAGVTHRKPTAEIEERWDDRYDKLRDQTERVLEGFTSHVY